MPRMCDGCYETFDLESFDPPHPALPDGRWFCPACTIRRKKKKGLHPTKSKRQPSTYVKRRKRRPPPGPLPSSRSALTLVTPEQPAVVVTMGTALICDGCEGEFDMELLNPPLMEIPKGDWFCGACVEERRRKKNGKRAKLSKKKEVTLNGGDDAIATSKDTLCSQCGLHPVTSVVAPPEDRSSRRRALRSPAAQTTLCESCSRTETEPIVMAKKRKRDEMTSEAGRGRGAATPTSIVFASREETLSAVNRNGLIVCSDDEDDHLAEQPHLHFHGDDDDGTSGGGERIIIRLKKNRKKKQRISKQMWLEMQLYGRLLRTTAAKEMDPLSRALRARPPTSETELLAQFALVGKRVGVCLAWDKQWVVGRVMSFDANTARHVMLFDDKTEHVALPLFALPCVIGTTTYLEVRTPSVGNEWRPAQVLELNDLAKRELAQPTSPGAHPSSFLLVSVFSGPSKQSQSSQVACWVPRQWCRALSGCSYSPEDSDDAREGDSAMRSTRDQELAIRQSLFRRLLLAASAEHSKER
ncbi:hypothetical protein PINS_up021803 [Pythium insidiosum]|nr:hypothetical protein PINS_up021803 [Pythium insidiosum]